MSWRDDAACKDQPHLFYDIDMMHQAIDICDRCPVIRSCELFAPTFDRQLRQLASLHPHAPMVVAGRVVGPVLDNRIPAPRVRCLECDTRFEPQSGNHKLCSPACQSSRIATQKRVWATNRKATV